MLQGTTIPCVYCTILHPEQKSNCKKCRGTQEVFQPARMSGPFTSHDIIAKKIEQLSESKEKKQLLDAYVSLLSLFTIYGKYYTALEMHKEIKDTDKLHQVMEKEQEQINKKYNKFIQDLKQKILALEKELA